MTNDLRIADAPLLVDVSGEEKLPTGGYGNYSTTINQIADFTQLKWKLATEGYVNNEINVVTNKLNTHTQDKTNPHGVTKEQVGLGEVDNTADLDKPVSAYQRTAIDEKIAKTSLADNLTTNDSTKVLSAKQGKLLQDTKANKTDVNTSLNLKADKSEVYTKDETLALEREDRFVITKNGRTQREKNSDIIFVEDHGAIGDGKLHKLSEKFSSLTYAQVVYPFATSLNQSIDWCAFKSADLNSNGEFYGRSAVYCLNEHLELNSTFIGQGYDEWQLKGSWRPRKMKEGTTLLFCETPTIFVNVEGVSDCRSGGGVLDNAFYNIGGEVEQFNGNKQYSLLDFTNADANGAVKATPKNLKVCVKLNKANVNLVNCRVQINYDGVDGYNCANLLPNFPEYTENYYGMGDDWDIGVLSHNIDNTNVVDAQVVGYFRMAARCVVSSGFFENSNDALGFGGGVFNDERIFYQGYNGLSVRSNDTYRIISATSNTITLPWSETHQVPTSGYVLAGGVSTTFTGLTYNDSTKTLTLTGIVANVSAVTGTCCFGTNTGFAGSGVSGGFINGLGHFSNLRAYDSKLETPFNHPSKAYEISGNPMRDIDFDNVHFFDTDVIGFLHNATHTGHTGCYAEAQGFDTSKGVLVGKGARYIASATYSLSQARGSYPSGSVNELVWDQTSEMSDGSVDLYPMYKSTKGRFIGDNDYYFMPNNVTLDCAGYWAERKVSPRRFDVCSRIWMTEALGGTRKYLEIVDRNLKRYMRIDGINDYVGFGITNPSVALHIARPKSPTLLLDQTDVDTTVDPAINLRNSIGSWVIRPQASSINQLQVRYNNVALLQVNKDTGTLFSGSNGTADIGTSSNRYKNVYTQGLNVVDYKVFADNISAKAGGLTEGMHYRTATGVVMVVY